MKNKIIIPFLILIAISCEKPKEKQFDQEKKLDDSILTVTIEKDDITITEKEKISYYNLDRVDTTITIYYQTGEARYIQNYNILGELTGKWINFYKNGKIKQEGHYSNGQAKGNWKYYNEDGSFKNEEFIELDTNCVRFAALWDSETISNKIDQSKRWVFRNYTVDVWDRNTLSNKKNKITELRASSYARIIDFNGEDYLIEAPMDGKIGWINKSHVKTISIKNKLTKKLCD